MAGPIYSFTAGKMTEAWYQLSKEEQDSLMAKVRANRPKAGVKTVIVVNCSGFSEWDWFIVDELPDLEALRKSEKLDGELDWHRYWTGNVIVGTKWEEE